jgi:hypothetical protein
VSRVCVSGLHGIRITSPWPLGGHRGPGSGWPELELREAAAPLRADPPPTKESPKRQDWFRYERLADGSNYLRWSGLSEFTISPDGRRIACRVLDRCPRETLLVYLLGQVLSFALVKRGVEPLHATAVMIDGEAVAFVGDCGYGKSTLGAAFLQEGCALLTDDLLVVTERGGRVSAYPGPARIKLLPGVARRLLGRTTVGTPMNAGTTKLVIPLDGGGAAPGPGPFPLRAIYVLNAPRERSRRTGIAIRSLPLRRAFLAVVRNTFNPVVADPARLGRLLDQAARLALKVPLKSLSFPRTWASLPAVRRAIRADLEA